MNRWAAIGLTLSLLSACSTTTPRIESHPLGAVTGQSGERYIIAAVDNDSTAFLASAGSTPHGYDSIAAYGPTSRAQALMRSLARDYGLREISEWPIEPLHMHCAVLQIPDGADRAALLATISADPRIRLAQPLQTFATRSNDYNDPYVELQLGLRQMNVLEAHPWSTGDGVKVAIVDTGADIGHPDLRGRIAAADNFVDADAGRFRRDRHGTEMAGAIAAVANNHEGIVGVAPGARLFVFKACWQLRDDADAASCNSFTLARALVAALDAHVQIINLSLTGPDDPLLRDIIHEGLRRGVVFVGAASSVTNGRGLLHQPGVIEVASAETLSPSDTALYAPGRDILTLMPGGRYDFATGDSIATAQVSGVVALLLAARHTLTADAAYKLLQSTSNHPASGSGIVAADSTGAVDACAAMTALLGRGTCTQPTATGPADDRAHRLALH
ncbi:MAG: S8 family serine peptidase [Steroidobacteraceae bacterium]|jgi:subtilisin family serine protease